VRAGLRGARENQETRRGADVPAPVTPSDRGAAALAGGTDGRANMLFVRLQRPGGCDVGGSEVVCALTSAATSQIATMSKAMSTHRLAFMATEVSTVAGLGKCRSPDFNVIHE
jgi:hypothetical protein